MHTLVSVNDWTAIFHSAYMVVDLTSAMHHLDRYCEGPGHKKPTVVYHFMVELLIPMSCGNKNSFIN